VSIRRLFVVAAVLDFAAGIAFLVVRLTSRATTVHRVTTSQIFAAEIRNDGVAATVDYATIAVAIGHGRQRLRATAMLIITTCVDAFVMTTPVAGITQQLVMAAAMVVKLVALGVLWAPKSSRAFFQHTNRPVRIT
jgi:hypothetical protein